MNESLDGIKQAASCTTGWQHWIPFAALMAKDAVPQNRPMATRLMEQAFVAIIAGGGSAYTATPPPVGIRKKFRIRAGATSPETKTFTLDTTTPYFKIGFTFAQPTASDANKISTVEVERSTNGHWIVVSPQNVWL